MALRILVGFGVLVTLGLFAMPFLAERERRALPAESEADQNTPVAQAPAPAGQRDPVSRTARPYSAARDASVPAAQVSVWREVAPDAQGDALPKLRDDVADARLVAFERDALFALAAGQRFALLLPQQGEVFEVEVEAVRTTASGSRTIHGRLSGEKMHTAVITLGRTGVFGSITTPSGAYTVTGAGELAWIVDDRELRRHIDYTKPDYQVVPQETAERG